MHPIKTQEKIFNLWKEGKNQSEASRALEVPRSTVRDYYKRFSLGEYPNWHRGPAQTRLDLFHCGFESHLAYQYLYLLGMYLGDGHITKVKSLKNGNHNYRLRIFLDNLYPEIISRTEKAIEAVFPNSKALRKPKKQSNCTVVYAYSNAFAELFPQHGPGTKHSRKITLENWQKRMIISNPKPFVKGLIESDGCRYLNIVNGKAYSSYSFTNKSEDLHSIFEWSCGIIGVYPKRNGKNNNIRTRKAVELLDEFIGPKT